MRIWLDFSNSPHPLLFRPIARRLEELDHDVMVTARHHAQTVELTRSLWPRFDVVGGPSPASRTAKARALGRRIRALADWASEAAPDLALSHNSYAQVVAARAARVPVVTAMDYEYQPASHLAFRLADRVVLPDVLPRHVVRRYGASRRKTRTYSGLKEELYLADFEYDESVAEDLRGSPAEDGDTLVVVRTPPAGALYHQFDNPLFTDTLRAIGGQPEVRCVALARHLDQREALERLGLSNVLIPRQAVDARSLLYSADLVLGGGGTMTREAALMGVPTLSLFAGRVPAADRHLEERGLLQRLTDPDQVRELTPRRAAPLPLDQLRSRGRQLVDQFVAATMEDGF